MITKTKLKNAMTTYTGFRGAQTLSHIERNVVESYPTINNLTGKQIGRVLDVANKSYQDGKASTGAEVIDDCIYINNIGLLPLDILKQIKITETRTRQVIASDTPSHAYQWHTVYADEQLTQRIMDRGLLDRHQTVYYEEYTTTTTYSLNASEIV